LIGIQLDENVVWGWFWFCFC